MPINITPRRTEGAAIQMSVQNKTMMSRYCADMPVDFGNTGCDD
jgi:hypothetical protein